MQDAGLETSDVPPRRRHTREDSGIRLDADGRWWHDEERVEHPRIVAAFDAGLQPSEDGRFKLVVGNDWCFVEVQGAAYRVIDAVPCQGGARLVLSDGTEEPLDPSTLALDATGVLTCRAKAGLALARFSRAAQVQLGACLEREGEVVVLCLGNQRFATAIGPSALEEGPTPQLG